MSKCISTKTILADYDMSGGDIEVEVPFSSQNPWSIQAIWDSLDAADATLKLEQSNDGTNFAEVWGDPTITMTGTSDTDIIEDDVFTSFHIKAVVAVNSVTSGTLSLIITV